MSAVMIFYKIGVRFGMREMTVERETVFVDHDGL